jgi:hypothetical protein
MLQLNKSKSLYVTNNPAITNVRHFASQALLGAKKNISVTSTVR